MSLKRIVLLWCLWLPLVVFGQSEQAFLSKMNTYQAHRPVEKIHLQLDKFAYTAGETIWFKLYNVLDADRWLSNLSQIAYIDLIDPKGDIVDKAKIPLVNGLGMADITLIDTLVEGTYRLRAYTNWMRNDASDYFYDQNLTISNGRSDEVIASYKQEGNQFVVQLNDLKKAPLPKTSIRYVVEKNGSSLKKGRLTTDENGKISLPLTADFADAKLSLSFDNAQKSSVNKIFKLPAVESRPNSVQFFPEGGTLLLGGMNGLAVKSLRPNGKGMKSTTYVLTANKDTATIIETNYLGMGSGLLFIDEQVSLKAHTVFEDGTSVESDLPALQHSGINMLVNNLGADRLYAQVNISQDRQNNQEIYFLVQYMGRTYHVAKQKANKKELTFFAPKASLPSGVLTVTILDSDMRPLIERPVFMFKNAESILDIVGQTNAKSYAPRKKVAVSIEVGEATDTVRYAALSASVLDVTNLKANTALQANIYSNLFLNADVKGYIEDPGYYFDQTVKVKDIDQLLQTQAWRKLDLTASLDTVKPAYAVEEAISIKGQTRKVGRKSAFPNAHVTLISTKNFMDFIDTVANANGDFEFDNLLFPDSVKFIVSAKDDKGKKNIDIIVPTVEPPVVGSNKNWPDEVYGVNKLMEEELLQAKAYFAGLESQGLMEKSLVIESITVTARKPRSKASESSTNLNGPGNADQVISADDLSTCATLDMCLSGRLLGVMFRGGIPYSTRGGGEMQVILDGMYIQGDQLSSINVADVASVEVLRNSNYTAIYGMYGGNGVIIITSKTGKDAMASTVAPLGMLTIQPQGFYVSKTFYKPIYEVDSTQKLNQDLRSTIHWEPNIVTDKAGKAAFDFYTADRPGKYLITIEGVDFNGKIGHKTLEIEVK